MGPWWFLDLILLWISWRKVFTAVLNWLKQLCNLFLNIWEAHIWFAAFEMNQLRWLFKKIKNKLKLLSTWHLGININILISPLEYSHQLSKKKGHFDTPKTHFIILAHHFTTYIYQMFYTSILYIKITFTTH